MKTNSLHTPSDISIPRVFGFILVFILPWVAMLYINIESMRVSHRATIVQDQIRKEEKVKSSLRVSQSKFPLDQQIEEFAKSKNMRLGINGLDTVMIPKVFSPSDQSMVKMNKNISVNSIINSQ